MELVNTMRLGIVITPKLRRSANERPPERKGPEDTPWREPRQRSRDERGR
jgi:hypothetical protein